jgi:hypothetical protein
VAASRQIMQSLTASPGPTRLHTMLRLAPARSDPGNGSGLAGSSADRSRTARSRAQIWIISVQRTPSRPVIEAAPSRHRSARLSRLGLATPRAGARRALRRVNRALLGISGSPVVAPRWVGDWDSAEVLMAEAAWGTLRPGCSTRVPTLTRVRLVMPGGKRLVAGSYALTRRCDLTQGSHPEAA